MMVGHTLADLRGHVESLSSDDGAFFLVCARTGDRPVPAAGRRFDGRATARSAARAVERYRSTLRRYDPRVPHYDVIVCQDTPHGSSVDGADRSADRTLSEPVLDAATPRPSNRALVEFCHRVAAAVFESLSTAGHDAVEETVMDAYTDLADRVTDPDCLCLHLLEQLATEMETGLTAAEQASLLAAAATRLEPLDSPDERPVSVTLDRLVDRGLLGAYCRSPWSVDIDDGRRSVDVRLSAYALSPRRGRLPVFPLVIELHRRRLDWPPSSIRATDIDADGGWRVSLAFRRDADPVGLASAPIEEV
jgi:hypothetical protein